MSPPNLEKERASKLAEIGSHLKQVREDKGVSLDHVAAKTMIQPRLLTAIEEGDLEQLPEPVYTQGFIRRFADALGLNGAEVARKFPVNPTVQQRRVVEWRTLPAAQLRPIHLYVLYIVLIVSAVSGLSYLVNRSTVQLANPSPTPLPTTSPLASGSPTASPKTRPTPKPTTAPVAVTLSLTQDSWMRVVADGKTSFEGDLTKGTKRTFTAKQKLVVLAGNAGGVMIAAQGAMAKPMGETGVVKELTFTAPAQAQPQSSNNRT